MIHNNKTIEIFLEILKAPIDKTIHIDTLDLQLQGDLKITPHMKLLAAKQLLLLNFDIEEILELSTWKDFESFIEEILKEHDFTTAKNIRFREAITNKLFEIDVLAVSYNFGFAIDCKKWKHRAGKRSSLRKAALMQKKRTIALKNIRDKFLKIDIINEINKKNLKIFPLIVTWANEDIDIIEGIPIVPVSKFNQYILKFDEFSDYLFSI